MTVFEGSVEQFLSIYNTENFLVEWDIGQNIMCSITYIPTQHKVDGVAVYSRYLACDKAVMKMLEYLESLNA